MNVAGSTGVSGYRITTGPLAGKGFLASAHDGGSGAADEILYSEILALPPATCPAPSEAPPPFEVSGGGGPVEPGALTIIGGPTETLAPWKPEPATPSGPGPSGGLRPSPHPAGLALVPERSLGSVRLGERRAVQARPARVRVGFDRRRQISTISTSSRGVTLYGRALDRAFASMRPILLRRGWGVTRCGELRAARRRSAGRSTTIVWRGSRLLRVTLTRGRGAAEPLCSARRRTG